MVEAAAIALCESLNAAAFRAVAENVRAGMTEQDVQRLVQTAWNTAAACEVPFSGDLIGGVRSGAIEGEPTAYVLQTGDALIVDIQPGVNGCFADTTRTFFIGEAGAEQRRVYAAVEATLRQLEAALRPGVRACELYHLMQQSLAEFGLSCPHHAGHALGCEKLLPPEFVPDCTDVLQEGMIVALEPGAYCEGAFGVRLENNYRITADGAECLFRYPLAIEDCIV